MVAGGWRAECRAELSHDEYHGAEPYACGADARAV